ncbi:MAG: Fic family protein [Lachnobacterium sp.]|nr:Fic family protein [Lachnobacterium sp.]
MNFEEIFLNVPKPHIPEKLPIELSKSLYDCEIIKLISKANNAMGAYRGFLINTINPMLLISPLVSQEAVLSSKLEGTHATIEDFINYDAGNEVSVSKDEMQEVVNYRSALYFALGKMSTISDDSEEGRHKLPLSVRLIKEMHKILLDNVRGQNKSPGEFKMEQNYIGNSAEITFTPLPPELTQDYMANFEQYIHFDEVDLLVQAALIHCQFEMIHPFKDGNGRIGRLLIPLFLYYREMLPVPTFYMSAYFEKDRTMYLEKLSAVSQKNDYATWIKYFLEGVIQQAEINTLKAKALLDRYNEFKDICISGMSSKYAIPLLDEIFQRPAFKAKQIQEVIPGSKGTLYNMLDEFVARGILRKDDKARNATYFCPAILSII